MKKILFEVKLPYNVEVNEEQFKILNKYFNIEYKSEEHFKLSSYDDKYKEMNEDECEQYKKDKYKEYLAKEFKEIVKNENKAVVDLILCAEECTFVSLEILKKVEIEFESKITDFSEIVERFEKVISKIPENTFNSQCDVHIGGSLLMNVNDLKLLEDCCTDKVQEELNKGWRIVSCCVQPDGRRPDYILGRYEDVQKMLDISGYIGIFLKKSMRSNSNLC